ncbi:MAG: hypothetical protein HY520_01270 [Candidatus Aenigmarchaeota archaeon]|nr:hypothetical protein [Candidatus Aenigmarchaeota archaeon]
MNGFLLSMEALLAVGLLLLVASFLGGITVTTTPELRYERLYITAKDALNVLENARIGDAEGIATLESYQQQGIITAANGSLLDAIGFLWSAGNTSLAAALAEEVLNQTFNGTGYNWELVVGNTTLASRNASAGSFVARISTVVSGYDLGKPAEGFAARASLSNPAKQDRAYAFFGGYVGDGNLTALLTLPNLDTVLGAEMEMSVGGNFSLYVNGNFSGSFVKNATTNLTADRWTLSPSALGHFRAGQNVLELNFSGQGYVGGGYLAARFNTTELVSLPTTAYGANATAVYHFPGVRGVINVFDAFAVPGNLTNLSLTLTYQSAYPVFLTIGNVTVYRSNASGWRNVTLNHSNLSAQVNYSQLSGRTVPLRVGTENISISPGLGSLDSSLITDRSGSMTSCDVVANCSDSNLCDSDPSGGCHARRNIVALEADKTFVDVIISTPGNNVGLIGFGERGAPTCSFTEVTSVNSTLQGNLDDYNYNNNWQSCGYTCISCGVEASTIQLLEQRALWGMVEHGARNTSALHVGDTGAVAVNVTFDMGLNLSRFVKGRIVVLGTNTNVDDGYQDCVLLNNQYLGRICESDGLSQDSWHTCLYPLKQEWVRNGQNVITITGGNTAGCFGTAGEQDDWDFKSVEMTVWEARSLDPNVTRILNASTFSLNTQGVQQFGPYADAWELQSDLPYPIDFSSGYNTSGNTFGLSGAGDGWDWQGGAYGYDTDVDFNGAVAGQLTMDTNQGGQNACSNRDCSGAYGVSVNVTPSLWAQIQAGSQLFVSFQYQWDANDGAFESSDQVWIKANWTSPSSGRHELGSAQDGGDSGADNRLEVWTEDSPDTEFSGTFSQNVTPWVEGAGIYYLDFGGKLLASSSNEWGTFLFDDIGVGLDNGTPPGIGVQHNLTFTIANMTGLVSALAEVEVRDIALASYDCVFLNDTLLERFDEQHWNGTNVWQQVRMDLPAALLREGENHLTFTAGTAYGCRRTGTNDAWEYRNANITLISSNETAPYARTMSMLIMSDGAANTKLGDCRSYGSGSCTTISGGESPENETVRKACEANDRYGIRVFAVAFGDAGQEAIDALNRSAACDDPSNFYTSNDKDELLEIYRNIAQNLVNLTFDAQTAVYAGNVSLNNTLYADSLLQYWYVSAVPSLQFGEVTFSFASPPFRNQTGPPAVTDNSTGTKEGWFVIPPETTPIEARVTSYSSAYWTDQLFVRPPGQANFSRTFALADWGSDYTPLGDPFHVVIPAGLLAVGNTSVKLGTGLAPGNATGGSPDARVLYTIRLPGLTSDGYSGVFPEASGATVRVYYDLDGDNRSEASALVAYGPDPLDQFDPWNDSVDDAFLRLLDNLNLLYDANTGSVGSGTGADPWDGINSSNPVEIELTEDVSVDASSIRGITSLWGPVAVEIKVWI